MMTKQLRSWLMLGAMLSVFSFGISAPDSSTSGGLVDPVNMSLKDDLLLISDRVTGVHVYDVADPTAPALKMTIPLKRNHGTAMKDDILYANDSGSLLAIRILDDTYEIVKTITHEPDYYGDVAFYDGPSSRGFGCACSRREDAVFAPTAGSTGSSFATFAVIGDYLYYLDGVTLVTADIALADDPKEIGRDPIGWSVETLYPTDDYLFIGGTRGMYIFDRSDPTSPREIGRVEHFRACDPVVVSGTVAYVTLRGGNRCGESSDVLLCVNIENPAKPVVLGEKPMSTPYGLAIEDPLLYVSTGSHGYELLDVTKPAQPSRIEAWTDRATRDFIWSNDILYVLGFNRAAIFDVTSPERPVLLSEIPSKPKIQ